jgi:hypothetical protein
MRNPLRSALIETTNTAAAVASFLAPLLLFLPSTVYLTNPLEFSSTYGDLVRVGLPLFVVAGLLLTLAVTTVRRMSRAAAEYLSCLLLALGFLMWLQGNFLLWPYGTLDGRDIPWSVMSKYGYVDGTMWVVMLVGALFFARRVYRAAVPVNMVLVVTQLAYCAFLFVQEPTVPSFKRYQIDEHDRFVFSNRKNVIVLVLDSFQTDAFSEIVHETPGAVRAFDGFTYFRNALGSFPFTELSVASILTGQCYDNSMPFEQWKEKAYTRGSVPSTLKSAGWRVHLFPNLSYSLYYSKDVASNFIEGVPVRQRLAAIARVYDLALFRSVPHRVRQIVHNEGRWVFRRWFVDPHALAITEDDSIPRVIPLQLASASRESHRFSPNTLQSPEAAVIDAALTLSVVDSGSAVFKYFHLNIPHWPLLLNEDLQWGQMEATRLNYKRYATAGLKLVGLFLERLKELGVYDNTLIFVVGDHGAGYQNQSFRLQPGMPHTPGATVVSDGFKVSALPLVLIKPPTARGALRVSDAPVSLSDVPATVFAAFGLPAPSSGTPMFAVREDQDRERHFFLYSNKDYYTYYGDMTEFAVRGRGWEDDSWRYTGRILTRHGIEALRLTQSPDVLFDDIRDYGLAFNGFHHVESANGVRFHWTDGAASIKVPLEPGRTPDTLEVGVLFAARPQLRLRILVDDCEVASEVMPGGNWAKSISLRGCTFSQRWTTIRFLSETVRPGGRDKRDLGVALSRVVLRYGAA